MASWTWLCRATSEAVAWLLWCTFFRPAWRRLLSTKCDIFKPWRPLATIQVVWSGCFPNPDIPVSRSWYHGNDKKVNGHKISTRLVLVTAFTISTKLNNFFASEIASFSDACLHEPFDFTVFLFWGSIIGKFGRRNGSWAVSVCLVVQVVRLIHDPIRVHPLGRLVGDS